MELSNAGRRAVQALASLAIVLVVTAMVYAVVIGWINYARIGV